MITTDEIKLLVEKQQLIESAKEAFYNYINGPENLFDEPENLTVQLYKIQLVINYQFDEPVEYLQIILSVLRNDDEIADYSYLTTLSGKVMDDGMNYY